MKKILIALTGFLCLVSSIVIAKEQRDIPPDTKISLERTRCRGTCPAYEVTIYADGKVEFIGKLYIKGIGNYTKQIPSEDVQKLLTEFEQNEFFTLNEDYTCADARDLPSAIITITTAGKTKEIRRDHGCLSANKNDLAVLEMLERKIDETSDIADWITPDTEIRTLPLKGSL